MNTGTNIGARPRPGPGAGALACLGAFILGCTAPGSAGSIASGSSGAGGDEETAGDDEQSAGEDSDEGTLVGRWRMVGYETSAAQPLVVTDENSAITVPGVGAVVGRVNGMMWLRADRVAFASALLFDDHVFPDPAVLDYDAALQVQGGAAPGVLKGDQFTLAGSAIRYQWSRQSDGTIVQLDATGARATWARAETLAPTEALIAQGQVAVFVPGESMPLQRPRVAIAWDLPGGSEVLTSGDEPLEVTLGLAWFPMSVAEAPAQAWVEVGAGSVAVGHLIVYDDVDDDGAYLAPADALRGVSPIGLAFRSATVADQDVAGTRYSELFPGWQYVHFHQDYSYGGAIGLAPFDPAIVVSPDLAIDVAPRQDAIPDVVP